MSDIRDHAERLILGCESLVDVKEILGDNFGFAQLSFYIDKTNELTMSQCKDLVELGFMPNGNQWVYRG